MEKKYLEMTKMLNFDVESIQSLIKNRKWIELDEYNKIAAIYDFVRNEILFGYNSSDLLSAEEVLKDGYGQCNTKATLLMALLRSVGIPCRLISLSYRRRVVYCFYNAYLQTIGITLFNITYFNIIT